LGTANVLAPMQEDATYICGINLAWINFHWSATPGVPVRMSAVTRLRDTVFATPTALQQVHVAVPADHAYEPHRHKGALKQVSPDEVTAAFIMAIARDIEKQEADDVLLAWKFKMRSTTCRFVVLGTDMKMYWYALEQREQLEQTYRLVKRSCYQRLHEVVRLMERMRQTIPGSEVTAKRVAEEYKANVKSMNASSSSEVPLIFVDTAKTVALRVLSVHAIAACMADLDDYAAIAGEVQGVTFANPFDSHSRLQAILDKCKVNNVGSLTWAMQGIWYHARKGNIKSLSLSDIKGSHSTGNRGYVDLLLFKRELRHSLLRKAGDLFGE